MATTIDELWDQGNALYDEGKRDEAAALWREALRQDPDHAVLRYNLGVVLHEDGETEAAITAWRETVRRHPDFWQAYRWLGFIYWQRYRTHKKRRDLRAARDAYAQVVALCPKDEDDAAQLFWWIGRMEEQFGSRRDAITALQRAIQADPSLQDAYFWIGRCQLLRGQWRAGVRTLNAQGQLPNYDPSYHTPRCDRLFLLLAALGAAVWGVALVVRWIAQRDKE